MHALLCLLGLCGLAVGHVHILNSPESSHDVTAPSTLSPVAARLVLAHRAGVESYHRSELSNPDVLDAINTFGERRSVVQTSKPKKKKMLVLADGDSNSVADNSLHGESSSFMISPAPSIEQVRNLWVDLAKQAHPNIYSLASDDEMLRTLSSTKGGEFLIANGSAALDSALRKFKDRIITLYMPEKGATGADWGTYDMPRLHDGLRKRKRDQDPLAPAATGSSSAPHKGPSHGSLCFASIEACEKDTGSCSGHGNCIQSAPGCFACKCAAKKDGKRTTYWAGTKCDKVDVSVQFWLIALFTVGLIGVISFAIGEVYALGNEKLPSVIGAGVAGIGARARS
ncbi:hypothetical protein K470DRAFT_259239 [Piedraia hortae CBS 480.64]|uniref:Uncharacterized protein n=1 Tax=Piedraia hortae CBS 480.64 TaxID=1314780 RepID=A0A6A7BV40_9PEZI|nr:hypothetical protein K470DRAFT_259239 [Piedraia hortae CBS 480.64]